MEQATVLYDFDGLVENNEITLQAGDIVTIVNKNIGDGWWEGKTPDGRSGLFPEAYVQLKEKINVSSFSALTPRYSNVPGENYEQNIVAVSNRPTEQIPTDNSIHQDQDDNEDAWSEEWEDSSSVTTVQQNNKTLSPSNYGNFGHDVISLNSMESRTSRAPGTVSKNLNRFSSFVKHGGEDFILGKAEARVRSSDQVLIVSCEDGIYWKDNDHKFTCTIENPKQQSKMKGLKKFICYNLTPSDTAVTVQRRYKHFDWLCTRLVERYPIVAIPRLPDKQASGRFEEDFIEARMARLKLWVSYICRHPLLSRSQLFRNFITLTEQKAWKMSKRQGEKDQLAAGNFFLTISIAPSVSPVTDAQGQLDLFKKTARAMDDAVSHYSSTTQNLANKYSSLFKKEYQTFGKAINNVANSFNMHQTEHNKALTTAMKQTGQAFLNVGEMFANQPKSDLYLMHDHLWLYKGLFDTMPDIWHMQTGATRKVKECRRLKEEGKMTESECGAIAERAGDLACCVRSEITHFHKERIRSFALAQRDLIEKQAQFFEKLAAELRGTLKYFDEIQIDP